MHDILCKFSTSWELDFERFAFKLSRQVTGFRQTRALVSKLIRSTLETGCLTGTPSPLVHPMAGSRELILHSFAGGDKSYCLLSFSWPDLLRHPDCPHGEALCHMHSRGFELAL